MAMNRFENAPGVTALLKSMGSELFRIVCRGTGKYGGPCPSMLGYAVFRDEDATTEIEMGMPARVWYAMQKDKTGYRKDENGHYLCGSPTKLRRPLTEETSSEYFPNAGDPYYDLDDHEYDFVGNWPRLPVHIYCPRCDSRNYVPEPNGYHAMYH